MFVNQCPVMFQYVPYSGENNLYWCHQPSDVALHPQYHYWPTWEYGQHHQYHEVQEVHGEELGQRTTFNDQGANKPLDVDEDDASSEFEVIERVSSEIIRTGSKSDDPQYEAFKKELDGNVTFFRLQGLDPKGFFLSGNWLSNRKRST